MIWLGILGWGGLLLALYISLDVIEKDLDLLDQEPEKPWWEK